MLQGDCMPDDAADCNDVLASVSLKQRAHDGLAQASHASRERFHKHALTCVPKKACASTGWLSLPWARAMNWIPLITIT